MADTNKNGQIDYEEPSRLSELSADYYTCSIAKNSKLYTPSDQYKEGSVYTNNSDNDNRGRDPENPDNYNDAGIPIDFACRNALMAKNDYKCNSEYNSSNA